MNGASWLLGGRYPWQSVDPSAGVPSPERPVIASRTGLSLAARPGGAFGLLSKDGSLGRLTLPLGVAVDDATATVFVLSRDGGLIFRYDPVSVTLTPLPEIGREGLHEDTPEREFFEARRFRHAANIAAVDGLLYVADPDSHRVQVFDIETLSLVRIHAGLDSPVDVAAGRHAVYILDKARGRIYRARSERDSLTLVVDGVAPDKDAGKHWTRIAVDKDERIYALDPDREPPELAVFDAREVIPVTSPVATYRDPAEARDRFPVPSVTFNRGGFELSAHLADPCHLRTPKPPKPPKRPTPPTPLKPNAPDASNAPVIGPFRLTRDGTVLSGASLPLSIEVAYEQQGAWISKWLDSDIYNCQWHLIEVSLSALPPASRVIVKTRTSNDPQNDAEALAAIDQARTAGSWRATEAIAGPAQSGGPPPTSRVEVLVQSGAGQFLQLQVELAGSGFTTPVVANIRLRFPRESLLEYLPAIYSQPEDQRAFLDRFLSIAQTTWSAIEQDVETFERFLDPSSVPASAMEYLASWLDLRLEGTWSAEEKRKVLQAMPRLRAIWGTVDGMSRWLRVYLVDDERYRRTRARTSLDSSHRRTLRRAAQLHARRSGIDDAARGPRTVESVGGAPFSARCVRRRRGDRARVDGRSGSRRVQAVRARVSDLRAAAQWVRTPEAEALLRRAIDIQKPAHTTYELVLVEPRFRIGDQSTIGLDTVIGAPPPAAWRVPRSPTRPAGRHISGLASISLSAAAIGRGRSTLERMLS